MKAGVDIGGTKISVSLTAEGGRAQRPALLLRHSEATVKTGGTDAVARQVIRLLGEACAQVGRNESANGAVGVAACGPFVLKQGLVELAAPNICGGLAGPDRGLPNDWQSALLEAPLRARFGQVRVENDAVAALEAERRWGALQGFDHCAYVTWSTGIGLGLCVDGHVLRGKHGNAGHAGHTFVSDDASGALCGCGNHGDVEALVAGNAMARRFGTDAASLMAAARTGRPDAVRTVDELCRIMGRMLYNLVVTLDLQRISIGGGVFCNNHDFLQPRLMTHIRGRLPALTDGFDVVSAGLGPELGDFAALALVT
jgi:glucokinase